MLAAEAREHDAEAVVADRDVARAGSPDSSTLRAAPMRTSAASSSPASASAIPISRSQLAAARRSPRRQVLLAVAFELFDAAEGVWHRTGPTCALPSPSRQIG